MQDAGYPHAINLQANRVKITFEGIPLLVTGHHNIACAPIEVSYWQSENSRKQGQARGLFCGSGWCSSCTVIVNGTSLIKSFLRNVQKGVLMEQ